MVRGVGSTSVTAREASPKAAIFFGLAASGFKCFRMSSTFNSRTESMCMRTSCVPTYPKPLILPFFCSVAMLAGMDSILCPAHVSLTRRFYHHLNCKVQFQRWYERELDPSGPSPPDLPTGGNTDEKENQDAQPRRQAAARNAARSARNSIASGAPPRGVNHKGAAWRSGQAQAPAGATRMPSLQVQPAALAPELTFSSALSFKARKCAERANSQEHLRYNPAAGGLMTLRRRKCSRARSTALVLFQPFRPIGSGPRPKLAKGCRAAPPWQPLPYVGTAQVFYNPHIRKSAPATPLECT